MNIRDIKIIDKVKKVGDQFGPEILMILAGVATIAAVIDAMSHAKDAAEIKERCEDDILDLSNMQSQAECKPGSIEKEIKNRKIQKNIELFGIYKWTYLLCLVSLISMFASSKISSIRIAELLALAKLNEDKLKIALKNAKDVLGEDGEEKLKKKIAEELALSKDAPFEVTKNPGLHKPETFIDSDTGAWIESTREDIRRAAEVAEEELKRNHTLSYRKWLMIMGVPDVIASANRGWNVFKPFKIRLDDAYVGDKPVVYIMYENQPESDFYKMTK